MKIGTFLLAAALLWPASLYADDDDIYYQEVKQWVVEPCAQVGAALQVTTIDRTDLTTLRESTAAALVIMQDETTRKLAAQIRFGDNTWESRRKGYPVMLRMCVEGMPSWNQ